MELIVPAGDAAEDGKLYVIKEGGIIAENWPQTPEHNFIDSLGGLIIISPILAIC